MIGQIDQPGEQLGRQCDGLGDEGLGVAGAHAGYPDDLGVGLEVEPLALLVGRRGHLGMDLRAVGRDRRACLVGDVEEAEQHVRRRVLDHERAASLPPQHQALGGQPLDGLAGGALADPELAGDLELVGDQLTRLPDARADALDELVAHLGVQRPGVVVVRYAHQACLLRRTLRWIADRILYKNDPAPHSQRISLAKGEDSVPAPHFLVHSPKDNVGVVVVEGLKAGTEMLGVVTENDTTLKLTAKQDIPIGHKVALKALKAGDTIIKYGEDIGRMVADAGMGEHVHVQNLKTKRW